MATDSWYEQVKERHAYYYYLTFIPRFTRPPEVVKEYSGRKPTVGGIVGTPAGMYQPDEKVGDMPSDYWGEAEVDDNSGVGGWKNKVYTYDNKKFSYGYFVFLVDYETRTITEQESYTDMYTSWYVDRTGRNLRPQDLSVSGDYYCNQQVFVLYGDRGRKPRCVTYPKYEDK